MGAAQQKRRPEQPSRWGPQDFGGIASMLTDLEVGILPSQMLFDHRWSPEQFFLAHVLADAEHAMSNPKERPYVIGWMHADFESDCPFLFVCHALNLDPQHVEAVLLAHVGGKKPRALA